MLITAVCGVRREKFCNEIGNFIILFGLILSQRKEVIIYGDEEVWKFIKDIKDNKSNRKEKHQEANKEIDKRTCSLPGILKIL